MLWFHITVFLAATFSATSATLATNLPALQAVFSFFSGDYLMNGRKGSESIQSSAELGHSRGQCAYKFIDYVGHRDKLICAPDDRFIANLLTKNSTAATGRPPLMVKCLQAEQTANATTYDSTLLMMESLKDIVSLLQPIGNATKRHEPGSCVLVLFYTESCMGCAHVAPYANMLPYLFPTLRIAAIDAFRFPTFNTEFGIVGLPTLLLFHQGRPVQKFYGEYHTFDAFVTRHTGIKPVEPTPALTDVSGPLPLQPVQKPDYMLALAWIFILLCMGNYFARSQVCKQIIEMIKQNWRECEAEWEHNCNVK